MQQMVGLVLAGGKSKRMGQDKAELPYKGAPLWQHQQSLLIELGCSPVWVNRNHFDFLEDHPETGDGPLAGIETALRLIQETPKTFLFVLPIDMPLLCVSVCQTLISYAEKDTYKHHAYHYPAMPFPCLLSSETLSLIQERHHRPSKERSVRLFLKDCHAQEVSLEGRFSTQEESFFFNTNTPEDWKKLC